MAGGAAAAGSINRSKWCRPRAEVFFTAPLFHSQAWGVSAFIYIHKEPLSSHLFISCAPSFLAHCLFPVSTGRHLKNKISSSVQINSPSITEGTQFSKSREEVCKIVNESLFIWDDTGDVVMPGRKEIMVTECTPLEISRQEGGEKLICPKKQ